MLPLPAGYVHFWGGMDGECVASLFHLFQLNGKKRQREPLRESRFVDSHSDDFLVVL